MAIISTGSVAKALWPGVNKFYGLTYDEHPLELMEIFDKHMSDKNFEEDVNVYGLGLAPVKDEGQSVSYDSMAQTFLQRYVHVTYGLGFIISEEAIEDNKYIELAEQRSRALAFAMMQTKENVGANILNNAFDSTKTTGADGIELGSSVHKLAKGGTFRNELAVSADLSEATLEQAVIDVMDMVNDAGLKVRIMPRKLIIPTALCFEAERLLSSVLQNDTANNAINAVRSKGVLPEGYTVNHYLTDADAWFIKTNAPDGMKYFERRLKRIDDDTDFNTNNVKFKATERYSVGWTDPRGMFCVQGA